jgi:probable DNA repair protein
MSAGPELQVIEKSALFERLARGRSAGVTVVTPNQRLSRALMLEFDAFQIGKALSVWEAPDILPFGAFVQRLYEDGLYADLSAELPMLLTPAQEEEVWKQVVGGSGLLAVEGAAAKCRDAWNLANLWRIRPGAGNQDTEAFARWLTHYKKKTENDLDTPRLPDALQRFLPELKRPKLVVAYAFDILPPQTKEFLDALGTEIAFCRPDARSATVSRTAFDSAKHEIEAAAQWARARLEAGGKRIGVVVPSLPEDRKEVARVFSRVMRPGGEKAAMPFNMSIGIPLERYPVVALALSVLRVSQEEIPFEEASRLVRSPFIGGAEAELGARMRLEVRLREKLGASVVLPKLIAAAGQTPQLRVRLEKLYALRETGLFSQKTPAEWARHFSSMLEAAGFPGERALDSDEFQTQAKWHEALGELSRLDRISKEMSFSQAFQTLRKICAEPFQPETPNTPIQVLGVFEAEGMVFDHLWVTGLTDEAWPLKANPNPFLPLVQQRKAGIPEASAESSLARGRQITDGWKQAAGEVVFSHFTKEEDRDVLPSPLIADLPEKAIEIPAFSKLRDVIFASRKTETLQDRVAPAVREKQVRGGTRVLSDQAACPFRAFARHRLHADELEEPAEGLDASKRGKLVHLLMQNVWDELKDSTALQGDLSPAIERAAAAAVKEMAVEGRFAELERKRLARLGHEWFEKVEKQRPPFSVVSTEEKRPIVFSGVTFDARIDRMDRLESGGHAIVDYKTGGGNVTAKRWQGERPDEPQLPLYAVSAKEEITAVVFARFRPGDMRFVGLSRDDKALPKVPKAKDGWQPLLRDWKKEAERLGSAFAGGEAGVDPKKDLMTCRYCGLETLCRVYEKINVLAEEEIEEW